MNAPGIAIAWLTIVCVVSTPLIARADVVELMNGERIAGKVTQATATVVVIQVRERTRRIRQDRVRSITFEPEPRVAPAKVEPAPAPEPATTALVPSPRPLPAPIATALTALDVLQVATADTLEPADYAARVDEARAKIEQALAEAPDAPDFRSAIDAAVDYHAFAVLAETLYAERGDLSAIGRGALAAKCRPLSELISRDAMQLRFNPADPSVVGLFVATEGAAALRTCAGEKIAEAEARARAVR